MISNSQIYAPDKKATHKRFGIFVILWLLVLLNYVDRSTLSIALPYMEKDLGLSADMQGWILSLFFWTYLVFQVPGGWLLDKFGPRRVVSIAGLLWGSLQLGIGFLTSGTALGAARLGLGAFEAPTAPSGAKVNSSWLSESERGRGATFVDMAGPFGSAVGGVLVTAVIGIFGSWRWAFFVTGALTIVLAIIYWTYVRDTPEEHPGVNEAELAHIKGQNVENAGKQQSTIRVVKEDAPLPSLRDYAVSISWWGFWLGRLGWATVWWGIISWTPSYLHQARGFDLMGLGGATFLIFGMGAVGQLVAGSLADWGRKQFGNYNMVMKSILVGSAFFMAMSVLLIPMVSSATLCLAMLSSAVFFTNFGGLYWAIPAWLAPGPQVGAVGSVMNIASSLGGALAPVIMGYTIKIAGGSYSGAFFFLVAAAALYMLGSALINFRKPLASARS
ncbi:MFS transporter [Actinomyces faecalis]|uniref:MFS transporter n=1 Tax=Actinomyces faecalis TaxID=2722820 RepID=UPI00155700FC|nr:MFS transporter [Actinomyces faecalis]